MKNTSKKIEVSVYEETKTSQGGLMSGEEKILNVKFPLKPEEAFRIANTSMDFLSAEEAFAAWLLSGDVESACAVSREFSKQEAARALMQVTEVVSWGGLDAQKAEELMAILCEASEGEKYQSDTQWCFEEYRLKQRMNNRLFKRLLKVMISAGRPIPTSVSQEQREKEDLWMKHYLKEHPLSEEEQGF